MWIDANGVGHTVALPDPSVAMSAETVDSLKAMAPSARAELMDLLDDYYWNDYVARSRRELVRSPMAPEGAPLPAGYITAVIGSAQDGVELVKATEPAWRIDVLEALQDFFEPFD